MKRPKAKGGKFSIGQIVVVRDGYMGAGGIHRIVGKEMGKDDMHYIFSGQGMAVEFAIRQLTKKERGA